MDGVVIYGESEVSFNPAVRRYILSMYGVVANNSGPISYCTPHIRETVANLNPDLFWEDRLQKAGIMMHGAGQPHEMLSIAQPGAGPFGRNT